jgi:NADH dehydrogenase/NADH:ubiquinone oxidoreductase subunit G
VKGEKLAVLIKAFLAEVTARAKKTPQKGKRSLQGREIGAGTSSLLKGVGLPKAAQKAFLEMVEAFIKASNPLLLVGEAITGMKNPLAFQDAVNLALSKGLDSSGVLKLMVLKPYGNSAGAWKLGLSSNGNGKGKIQRKGGLLFLSHRKDLDSSAIAGLGKLDFLGVISPYFPDTLAEKADVVIPKPLGMEASGSYTSLDGWETGFVHKVLDPPEGVNNSWETLNTLADQIGFRHKFKTWDDLSKKAVKAIKSWRPAKQ